jgi:PEGA domain/TPR repeat
MRRLATLIALVACATAPLMAAAQEKSSSDLKRSGNEKMDASDFVGALDDYQAALKLDPNDATLHFNIGRAHGLLGHNVEALAELEKFGRTASAEMKARAQFDLLYAQTKAKVAFLTVTCSVQGARVLVGQKLVGNAPLAHVPVDAAATARVSIDAEGYRDDAQNVQLAGGREVTVQCRLLPKSSSGTLVVTSNPAGSRIAVDGKEAGQTPAEIPLPAGPHTIVARQEGYDDLERRVMLESGDQKTVNLPMSKQAAITSRWWFWTGIGVVVVTGIVVTAALLTEKSPDKGTIPPGQLPAPLVRF